MESISVILSMLNIKLHYTKYTLKYNAKNKFCSHLILFSIYSHMFTLVYIHICLQQKVHITIQCKTLCSHLILLSIYLHMFTSVYIHITFTTESTH